MTSRINITTFVNLPEMFRRYICHLQCLHMNVNRARSYKVRYFALAILPTEKFRISDAQLLTGRESSLCVSPAG